MIKLMIYAGSARSDAPQTRTGGVPLAPEGFVWPRCSDGCTGPMRFLAQVRREDLADAAPGLLSFFMCDTDPGMCDSWNPAAGANAAFVFPSEGLRPANVPPGQATLLDETSAVTCLSVEADNYDKARTQFGEDHDRRAVLGQLGGEPSWLQADETPSCQVCDQAMSFAVQLEEGHDNNTAANFGGGCAYGFRCTSCDTAAFLWQC